MFSVHSADTFSAVAPLVTLISLSHHLRLPRRHCQSTDPPYHALRQSPGQASSFASCVKGQADIEIRPPPEGPLTASA
jgi:hypothetical protein